jgi:hypothetical protein
MSKPYCPNHTVILICQFNSYFQAGKAVLAKDWKMAKKIQSAKTPKAANKLGREVDLKGLEWDKDSWEVMANAIYYESKKNPELRQNCWRQGKESSWRPNQITFGCLALPPVKLSILKSESGKAE